jgi:HEAT repeat protein
MAFDAMQLIRRQRLLLTLGSLAALVLTGCAELDLPAWVPFQGPATDTLAGVVTPAQRKEQLKKLAADAPKASPEQRQALSEQIAASIRTEQDPLIRIEILHALGAYPGPSADAVLKAAMTDHDANVRIAACEAWGQRGDDQAVEVLSTALSSDADANVRMTAAKALGATRNPSAMKPLGEALNDSDPAMQYMAVLALKQATGKDFGNNVEHWQQYVKDGTPPPPPSLTERLQRLF